MGNTKSTTSTGILRRRLANDKHHQEDVAPTLAMMSVARRVHLKKVHVMMLRYSMAKLSNEFGMIKRDGFERALVRANLTDIQVFDMLFALWDNVESGEVPYREFCIGISPLACPFDDLSKILDFAVRVGDDLNSKHIVWREVYELLTGMFLSHSCIRSLSARCVSHELLLFLCFIFLFCSGINLTAKYFGDEYLLPSEIDEIIETLFAEQQCISHKGKQ